MGHAFWAFLGAEGMNYGIKNVACFAGTSSVQVRVAEKMLGCETCGVISGFTL